MLKTSMFFTYSVDRWEGLSDDTDERPRFDVCSPGAGQIGVDDGLVEALLVVRHPRRISWTTFGRILDEEGQKSVNVEVLDLGLLTRNPTHFLTFSLP